MDRGINELFEGPTITYGNRKYILPPSSFAEAEIGLMTTAEIRSGLVEVLDHVRSDKAVEAPAIRKALRRNGNISLEDVMEKVKMHHEEQAKLITEQAVRQERMTGGGVHFYEIERRGDSRKEKNRRVKIELDSGGRLLHFSCPCETYDTNFAKGNYDPLRAENSSRPAATGVTRQIVDVSGFQTSVVHVACYHIASALRHSSKNGAFVMPFEFTKTLIYEALFMDVFGRKKEASIDDFLIMAGALTAETIRQIVEERMTLEVIKHSKSIDGRSKEIIGGIRLVREGDGYTFSGFATDFRGTPYQTTSIVFSKKDGRSVHILYDEKLGVELPFIMLNVPIKIWSGEGREHVTARLEGNPLGNAGRYVRRLDERTQQEVISAIAMPNKNFHFLTQPEVNAYSRTISQRMERQAALT